MIKTHSIDDDNNKAAKDFVNSITEPIHIKTIFETTDNKKTLSSNALLYQDILKFGIEHDYDVGFRFTDLANWLMEYNYEFRNYYTDSKSHVPKSARVAKRRDRIQRHIDHLEASDLIVQKAIATAQKNDENIPLYSLTIEGRLLALLIECEKIEENEKKSTGDCRTFQKVLEIINSYTKTKESFSLVFIITFFKNCIEIGVFGNIIRFFTNKVLLNSTIDKGRSLLGLFLGLDHLLYWIAAQPQMFIKTLQDLDQDTKKIIFFQLKMEIEEYHQMNYLCHDWDMMFVNNMANYYDNKEVRLKNGQVITQIDTPADYSYITIIPGSNWQMMRFANIGDHSKVCIPGFCINCNLEQSFTVDILEYIYSIISMLKFESVGIVKANCGKCNEKEQVIAFVVRFPWHIAIHLYERYKNKNKKLDLIT